MNPVLPIIEIHRLRNDAERQGIVLLVCFLSIFGEWALAAFWPRVAWLILFSVMGWIVSIVKLLKLWKRMEQLENQ